MEGCWSPPLPKTRSTTCSPCVVATTAIRMSMRPESKNAARRPSFGARRSADVELAHHLQPARDRLLHVPRHGRELAHDAVDANPDEHVRAPRLEVEVGCSLRQRGRQQRVDEGDRRRARGERADLVAALLVGRVVAVLDDQLQRRAVRPRDRSVDLPALGDGDPEAGAEREAQVVCRREIRRVGDSEERRAVVEDAQGQRVVPPRRAPPGSSAIACLSTSATSRSTNSSSYCSASAPAIARSVVKPGSTATRRGAGSRSPSPRARAEAVPR